MAEDVGVGLAGDVGVGVGDVGDWVGDVGVGDDIARA